MTFYLESIRQAWEFVLESGAGIGLVLILRWYWWRVNAWSEMSAMVAAAIGFALVRLLTDWVFPAVAGRGRGMDDRLVAPRHLAHAAGAGPDARRVLRAGHPAGTRLGTGGRDASAARQRRSRRWSSPWLAGTALVYAVLFGVGHLLLHSVTAALPYAGGGGALRVVRRPRAAAAGAMPPRS